MEQLTQSTKRFAPVGVETRPCSSAAGNRSKLWPRWRKLSVNLAPVADMVDAHFARGVRNFVDDPVVADADAPVVRRPNQFTTTRRSRIAGQTLNRFDDAIVDIGREPRAGANPFLLRVR